MAEVVTPHEARIRELWSLLPSTECKQLCGHYCTAEIPISEHEYDILDRHVGQPVGRTLERVGHQGCPLLDKDGRCTVYASRPTICRLWGTTQRMSCPWGCEPVGQRKFTADEQHQILRAAWEVDAADGVERHYVWREGNIIAGPFATAEEADALTDQLNLAWQKRRRGAPVGLRQRQAVKRQKKNARRR